MADNNIKIEIVGDSSKFVQELEKATKATQDFANKFKSSMDDMGKSLKDLNNNIKSVADGMNSLGTAIVGVGLTSFIANAMETANTTERLSDAVGITTAKYLEMSSAFLASGKDADALGRTMLRMEATAQQANDGNERLKNGYKQLGITMDELHNLTPDQAFLKVARALGNLDDAGKRAELTMMLLGRDAKTLDFAAIADGMENANGKFDHFAESNKAAADAYRAIAQGLFELKNNILELLEPLMKLIGDNAKGLIGSKIAAQALLAALVLIGGSATIKGISVLIDVFVGVAGAIKGATAASIAFTESLGGILAATSRLAAPLAALFGLFYSKDLNAGEDEQLKKIREQNDKLGKLTEERKKEYFDLINAGKTAEANAMLNANSGSTGGKGTSPLLQTAELHPELIRAQQLQGEVEAMNRVNEAQRKRIQLETELAGAGDVYRSMRLAQFDEDTKYENETAKLINKRKVLQLETANLPSHPNHEAEIAAIGKELDLLKQQHGVMGGLVAARQNAKNLAQMEQGYVDMQLKSKTEIASMEEQISNLSMGADAKRLNAVEKEIEKNIALMEIKRQQQLGPNELVSDTEKASIAEKVRSTFAAQVEEVKKLNTALHEQEAIMFAIELHNKASENMISLQHEMSQLTMTTDQKRIDDIKKQNDLMVEQEIIKRRMAKGYDENGNLKELDAGEMAKIRQQVTDANADIILKNQEIIDKSREFSTGWTAAFNQYKSDAENAAMAAKSMFSTMTTSFEDLMVNFVKTGSLDFKTFANNIIAEFVRIQAKQIALGIFGGSGTSSVMGSILGLPGRASGGPVTGNSPYLVGENGPELFVPKTSGQIVPNGAMGGSTQVTYNINAVDAPSFRTMLAREPELIYAITQKGANSIPSARY